MDEILVQINYRCKIKYRIKFKIKRTICVTYNNFIIFVIINYILLLRLF
jgi:hypothetical protein